MTLTVRLGDICHIQSGGTPSRSKSEFYGPGVPWAKISDIEAANGLLIDTEEQITSKGLDAIGGRLFPAGTLLFAIYGSIGKMAVAGRDLATNQAILGIQVTNPGRVALRYLYHWLDAKKSDLISDGRGITQKNLSASYLRNLIVPLPRIEKQRRVAAVLDQAAALSMMGRLTLRHLDALEVSTYNVMFGDSAARSGRWRGDRRLGDVAEIVSGITKGRKLNGQATRVVPYLAVANVQNRRLSLDKVKQIEATDDEIRRYRLVKNDLLLTEGGDPDKLGRGTLWCGDLPECIHQNHIFRVRLKSRDIHPIFLSWLVASERGKHYFFRAAKQTTGIASINMGQLRAFPLLLPPQHLQEEFAQRVGVIAALKAVASDRLANLDAFCLSLQHQAFSAPSDVGVERFALHR